MSNPRILSTYATDRYKQFWYPTRPLFTFLTGVFFAGLGYLGILPIGWALWLAASFGFDDLPLTPISSVITAVSNLANSRKKTKSIVMLASIILAIIAGAMLGFFVLSHSPLYLSLISRFIIATSCSPFLISMGAILGTYIAHKTGKMSHFMGVGLGIFIVSLLPIHIPLMLDLVYISAASCAFISNIVVKQALRLYYKIRYGHTNADGYEMNKSPEALEEYYQQQAKKFNVQPDEFKALINDCKAQIKSKKESASILDEFLGKRQPRTNAYKDIYHGLMSSTSKPQEVKQLIVRSDVRLLQWRYNEQRFALLHAQLLFGRALEPSLRSEFHELSIYPGIASNLVQPFRKK